MLKIKEVEVLSWNTWWIGFLSFLIAGIINNILSFTVIGILRL